MATIQVSKDNSNCSAWVRDSAKKVRVWGTPHEQTFFEVQSEVSLPVPSSSGHHEAKAVLLLFVPPLLVDFGFGLPEHYSGYQFDLGFCFLLLGCSLPI